VVPEDGDDRHAAGPRDVGEHLRLLGQPERRQVAGQQDDVCVGLDLPEGSLDDVPRLLAAVDVGCRGHADSIRAHAGILQIVPLSVMVSRFWRVHGAARQGRRERQYAVILLRLRTPHSGAGRRQKCPDYCWEGH
jgi:hypothetical protein